MTDAQPTERTIPDDAGLTARECPHHFDCDGIRCDPTVGDVPSSGPARDGLEVVHDQALIRDSDKPDLRSRGSLIVAASALRGASSLTDDDDTAQWLETLAQQFDDEAEDARLAASDEADEPRVNGDLLRVMAEYGEPAPGVTVGALDLDACMGRAWESRDIGGVQQIVREDVPALVAEVRRLTMDLDAGGAEWSRMATEYDSLTGRAEASDAWRARAEAAESVILDLRRMSADHDAFCRPAADRLAEDRAHLTNVNADLTREVEELRAKVAAVEARVVGWEALRDRLRAQNPVRKTGSSGLARREANTLDVVAEQTRAALATTGEGK